MKVTLTGDTTGSVYIILSVTWLGYTKLFHLQLLGKRSEYTAQVMRDAYENELRPVPDQGGADLGQGVPPPPGTLVSYQSENAYDRDRYGYEMGGGETRYQGGGYQADAVSGYKQSDDRGGYVVAKGLGRSEEGGENRDRGNEVGKSKDGKKKSHGSKDVNGKVKEKKEKLYRGH
jgi:hypothetical protein